MSRKDPRQAKAEKRARKTAKIMRRQGGQRRTMRHSLSLLNGLAEAEQLLDEGNLEDCASVLEELARRYPRRVEVYGMLVDVYDELTDDWACQEACRKLLELEQNVIEYWLNYASLALKNAQMATAHQAFMHILTHWPEHFIAKQAQEICDQLEQTLQAETAIYNVPSEQMYDLLMPHDEINFNLQRHKYDRVINLADRLLAEYPHFTPALNNRGEAWFQIGRVDAAIEDVHRVLEINDNNLHALTNLVRYLYLNGQFDEAHAAAERMLAIDAASPALFVKQAQALAFLGDWPALLDVLKRAEKRKNLEEAALLYHLGGVAAASLEQNDLARKYWKRALRKGGLSSWIQPNLDDLSLPIGEKEGPWAFPLDSWIPAGVIKCLMDELESMSSNAKKQSLKQRVRPFLEQHAYLEALLPVLLERGDSTSREFILRFGLWSKSPRLLSAMHDFAFGQLGSDKLRHLAATYLIEAGAIEPGIHRMWIKGESREINLMSFEIISEPTDTLPKQVDKLATDAWRAINDEDGARAEILLDKAIKLHPNNPTLEYNRTVAILLQGRKEEALTLARDLHARHPDYLFARTALAEDAIDNRDFEGAKALLSPMMAKRHFHLSEYTALCHAHIKLLSAQGENEGAKSWLALWEDVAPEDERLDYWYARLNKDKLFPRFFD